MKIYEADNEFNESLFSMNNGRNKDDDEVFLLLSFNVCFIES